MVPFVRFFVRRFGIARVDVERIVRSTTHLHHPAWLYPETMGGICQERNAERTCKPAWSQVPSSHQAFPLAQRVRINLGKAPVVRIALSALWTLLMR
jgi:hypothetical protein